MALNVATTELRATGCNLKDNLYFLCAESFNSMLKSFIVATAALTLGAPALAGPYVNVERNDGFLATDDTNEWGGAITELHVGYEGTLGSMPFYIQAGPAYLQAPSADGEGEISGKVGGSFAITESLGAYWEASFLTGEDSLGYASKLGAKWTF